MDYLNSGWRINLVAAIDFTASNGDPRSPESNHYLSDQDRNDYENALFEVGSSVEIANDNYNEDKSIQVYGFGGIPRHMKMNNVNDCFALNGNPKKPEIQGIKNVLKTYRTHLMMIDLAGPTHFGPLLE